jgi:hypothetical protein
MNYSENAWLQIWNLTHQEFEFYWNYVEFTLRTLFQKLITYLDDIRSYMSLIFLRESNFLELGV